MSISEQAGFDMCNNLNLACLLRDSTIAEIKDKPPLVHLYDSLKADFRFQIPDKKV